MPRIFLSNFLILKYNFKIYNHDLIRAVSIPNITDRKCSQIILIASKESLDIYNIYLANDQRARVTSDQDYFDTRALTPLTELVMKIILSSFDEINLMRQKLTRAKLTPEGMKEILEEIIENGRGRMDLAL